MLSSKAEKGSRKLAVTRQSGFFLLAGLLISLVAAGYFHLDTATCVQAYLIFAAGLVGRDGVFMFGNSAEYKFAGKPKPETPPPAA